MKLSFATTNNNKITEVKRILGRANITLEAFHPNVEEPEETGLTFAENSEIKFLYYEQYFPKKDNEFLITEDSGIEIMALEKFPSVKSARFLRSFNTKKLAFLEIKNMLQSKMNGVQNNFEACFICDICTRINGEILHFMGNLQGTLTFDLIDDEGFGYDPIFIPHNAKSTFAQMNGEKKDLISHRNKALQQLIQKIQ
jgi:XTP/dITP diphosphohydrolase